MRLIHPAAFEEPRKRRDLSDLVATWKDDPDTAAALEDQRRIDPEPWTMRFVPSRLGIGGHRTRR